MNKSAILHNRIIATMFATAVLFSFSSCNKHNNSYNNNASTLVSVKEIKPNSIKKLVSTYGSALPAKSVKLNSEISGKYQLHINPATHQKYKLGDKVKKGATIISLDDQYYINQTAVETKKLNYELALQEQVKKKALYEKGGVTLNDMKQSEVKVANAETDYENAKLNLLKMKVIVPFDGVITELPYFTENVKIDQNKLLIEIMDFSKLYLECNLPESSINEVAVNQPVFYTHYTLDKDSLEGKLTEISPAISMETRTFKTKLVINNKKLILRPGMFVKADICVKEANDAIVIDKDLVMTWKKNKFVYVADKNLAHIKYVTTGIEDDHQVEIIKGLKKGEQLIVKGYETLRDNAKIKINR